MRKMSHVLNCSNRSRNYKLQGSQVLKSSPPERRMTFRQPSLPALLPHQLTCNHMPSSHVIYNDFSHHYPHYHHFLPLFLLLLIVNTALCLPHPLPKEATPTAADELPHFSKPIGNQTAVLGRSTVLECSVDNLGPFNKVAWLKMDSSGSEPTVLTIGTQTLFNENKYRVSQNGHRQWYLHIKHIRVSDKGGYMCQVNAKTMISQVGYLHVQVPPIIIEDRTSSDTTVDEHQKAVLKCVAKGYPRPKISWRREDGQPINLGLAFGGKKNTAPSFEGDQLNLTQVTREDMGAYLCIASNGVPPSLSKRILLHVNFRPKIKVQKQLVNAHLGDSVELVCHCEAYPKPLVTWITPSGTPVIASTLQQSTSLNFSSSLSSSFSASTSSKYEIEEDSQGYRTTMKLKISTINTEDFGGWKCLSKNTLGEKEGLIRLFEGSESSQFKNALSVQRQNSRNAKANSLKSRKSRRPQSANQQFNGSNSAPASVAVAAAANDAADDDEEFEEDGGNFEDGEALHQGSPVAPLTDANSGGSGSGGRTASILEFRRIALLAVTWSWIAVFIQRSSICW